jgi:hypothetical protein
MRELLLLFFSFEGLVSKHPQLAAKMWLRISFLNPFSLFDLFRDFSSAVCSDLLAGVLLYRYFSRLENDTQT